MAGPSRKQLLDTYNNLLKHINDNDVNLQKWLKSNKAMVEHIINGDPRGFETHIPLMVALSQKRGTNVNFTSVKALLAVKGIQVNISENGKSALDLLMSSTLSLLEKHEIYCLMVAIDNKLAGKLEFDSALMEELRLTTSQAIGVVLEQASETHSDFISASIVNPVDLDAMNRVTYQATYADEVEEEKFEAEFVIIPPVDALQATMRATTPPPAPVIDNSWSAWLGFKPAATPASKNL